MSDAARLPQPDDVVGGKYRVERAIGAGGMGAVFRATNEVTGKAVALKWLRAEVERDSPAMKRFVREAQAASRIRRCRSATRPGDGATGAPCVSPISPP